jgi:stage III sporulation protein AD
MPLSIVKAAGFAFVAAILVMAFRQENGQLALCLSLAAGTVLLLTALSGVEKVLSALSNLAGMAGLKSETLALVMKLVGVAYITEFAVQACRDAQAEGIALKLSLCGKVTMLLMTLPLLTELSELVLSLTP